MKTLARIISIYFLFLIAIPTVKVVKSQLGGNCNTACQNEKKSESTKGCQKEKCILNFNFSTGHYIVQQIQSISFNQELEVVERNNLSYEKVFISKYQNTIWHPPKNIFFT
ncbi:MAG: hypothetical protein ABWY22_14435 [Flavobacterium sp.]